MKTFYLTILATFFLFSCSKNIDNNIEINQLIIPDYNFSNYFFDCNLNDESSLLKLESFLSGFIKNDLFKNKSSYSLKVFFPENDFVNKFKISIKNNTTNDIFTDVINELSQSGFDAIASCNFNSNLFNGLSLYNYTDKKQTTSNNAEILRCSYKPGFNYGTFRISLDRFISKMNQLKIQYGIDYFQDELNSGEFIWINYFYQEDFKNNISTQWLNDPDSTEIKNEFLDNAECIDAITYRFFQI
tara:strand:+ start:579 stop:1310 length:732 start_codon:yes stop_codon:yes gene_type:complete